MSTETLIRPSAPAARPASAPDRVLRLPAPETGRALRGPIAIAVALHLLLVGAGFLDRHDSLLDLIAKGETEAVAPVEAAQQEQEVILEETPPPPPEPNPDFVKPEEAAQPKPLPAPPKPKPVLQPQPTVQFAAQSFQVGDKSCPKPPYPYEAKLRHYQGTVLISLSVVDGKIVDAQVASSSGYGVLDSSTLSWVRQKWNFPSEVTRTLNLPVKFQLAGA